MFLSAANPINIRSSIGQLIHMRLPTFRTNNSGNLVNSQSNGIYCGFNLTIMKIINALVIKL